MNTPTRLDIADCLRNVIDPEVGLNIVDLGLIYDLRVEDGMACIHLTMTTPACPMGSYIKQEVAHALQDVPGLKQSRIETVWDPPWSPHMMSPEAKQNMFSSSRMPA